MFFVRCDRIDVKYIYPPDSHSTHVFFILELYPRILDCTFNFQYVYKNNRAFITKSPSYRKTSIFSGKNESRKTS